MIDEDRSLLTSIAKSEGLNVGTKKVRYTPIYKHPLPLSERKFAIEDNLRKVLSCKIPFQGMAAITRGDPWSLEEVFMRNGHDCLADKDGVSPLLLAIQQNQIECVMVLLNIGVDVNRPNAFGYTPLHVARSNNQQEIIDLLLQHDAQYLAEVTDEAPDSTILEVYPEQNYKSNTFHQPKPKDGFALSRSSQYF